VTSENVENLEEIQENVENNEFLEENKEIFNGLLDKESVRNDQNSDSSNQCIISPTA